MDKRPAPHFDERGRLVAPHYGDVYFSETGGLAETEHVFLRGNRLAERFAACDPHSVFTIGETGFGTGLNFLAAWRLFEQTADGNTTLRFFSVEHQPLPPAVIQRALSPWPELAPYAEPMLAAYAPPEAESRRLVFAQGRVELILRIGEVADVLADATQPADAWFLDGFTPARNPAMWSDAVFAQVARLSHPGTTLATYTAAGQVRRGLASAGFEIHKRPGFGTKRDMTAGQFVGPRSENRQAERCVLVIGAGLAGSYAARALAEQGWAVQVVDRQPIGDNGPASYAPRVALLQPKINDQDDPAGRDLRQGFTLAHQQITGQWLNDPRVGWQACGAFHAAHDPRSERRLRRYLKQFGPAGGCRWIEPEQTREAVGVALEIGGLLLESAGLLRPAGLCAALLGHPGIEVRGNTAVCALTRHGDAWQAALGDGATLHAQTVIVANATDARQLEPTGHLDLHPIRGQVSLVPASWVADPHSPAGLRRILCCGGYLTPAVDGLHTLGASFEHGETATNRREAEHRAVCQRLDRVLPGLAASLAAQPDPGGWAAVRCTTPTRRPYAGPVEHDGQRLPGLYASLGHGSHGITSAARSAQRIAEALSAGSLASSD